MPRPPHPRAEEEAKAARSPSAQHSAERHGSLRQVGATNQPSSSHHRRSWLPRNQQCAGGPGGKSGKCRWGREALKTSTNLRFMSSVWRDAPSEKATFSTDRAPTACAASRHSLDIGESESQYGGRAGRSRHERLRYSKTSGVGVDDADADWRHRTSSSRLALEAGARGRAVSRGRPHRHYRARCWAGAIHSPWCPVCGREQGRRARFRRHVRSSPCASRRLHRCS